MIGGCSWQGNRAAGVDVADMEKWAIAGLDCMRTGLYCMTRCKADGSDDNAVLYTRRCRMNVEWKWISCRWKLVCSRVQAVQAGRREVEWNCRHGCGMKFELQFKWWIYAEKEEQKQVEAVRLHQVCGGCYESVIDFGEVNSRCWQEFTEKTEYKTEQNKVALVVVVQVELQWNYGPSSELVSHGLFNC